MSDPDGLGATPTHQADTQEIDKLIWEPEEGSGGEVVLLIPFHGSEAVTTRVQEAHLTVEGRAVHMCHRQEKWAVCSPGSTAPASTPTMCGPWSYASGMREEDIYPDEHLFIQVLKDSDDTNETPYAPTTTGFPLYKGSYCTHAKTVPARFQWNDGDHFIPFPIQAANSNEIKQAEYIQMILHPNLMVVGLHDDSDKVYTKPLYTSPIYHYDGKLVYMAQELEVLKMDMEDQEKTDHMISRLHDPSLTAEIHRFWMVSQELD